MSFDLTNKKVLTQLVVNDFCFKISSEKKDCPFYVWTDDNAFIGEKAVELLRVNVNLSENDLYRLSVDITDFECRASKGDYLVFQSKNHSIYIVFSTISNPDLNGDFSIVNPSRKAVECSFIGNKLAYNIKDQRIFTNNACILDMWIIKPKDDSDNLINDILNDICL